MQFKKWCFALMLPAFATASVHAVEIAANYNCNERTDPERIVKAFTDRRIIDATPYAGVDDVSYFKVERNNTAFGFRLVALGAFKEGSPLFTRGPGTSAGNQVVPIVQATEASVLRAIHKQGLTISGTKDSKLPSLTIAHFAGEGLEPLPKGVLKLLPHVQIVCLIGP